MDIQDIRRTVLRALIKRRHNNVVRQFAQVIKKPDGQLNDMLATPPRKAFGERIARTIEKAYPLEPGYLDKIENASDEAVYLPIVQAPQSAKQDGNIIYGQFNATISEVIALMQEVDTETQRDMLGAVRVANSEYRMKHQNSTQRARQ